MGLKPLRDSVLSMPGRIRSKETDVAAPSETKTHDDTHKFNVFSNTDNNITDGNYWCILGLARLVRFEDLVSEWNKSLQGHYHAHVSWEVAKWLDNFKVDWSTRTETARHASFATGMLSETIHGGYRIVRHGKIESLPILVYLLQHFGRERQFRASPLLKSAIGSQRLHATRSTRFGQSGQQQWELDVLLGFIKIIGISRSTSPIANFQGRVYHAWESDNVSLVSFTRASFSHNESGWGETQNDPCTQSWKQARQDVAELGNTDRPQQRTRPHPIPRPVHENEVCL
ncbi:hypothetical protein PM082_014392 [Marasmius tenuissimus]|nr:hypothetical protein PM082_014392 [Marasmius tenuissimus]